MIKQNNILDICDIHINLDNVDALFIFDVIDMGYNTDRRRNNACKLIIIYNYEYLNLSINNEEKNLILSSMPDKKMFYMNKNKLEFSISGDYYHHLCKLINGFVKKDKFVYETNQNIAFITGHQNTNINSYLISKIGSHNI